MAAMHHGQHAYANYAVPAQEELYPPPSPTLTNPDLILPNEHRYSAQSPTYSDVNYSRPTSRNLAHHRNDSGGSASEVGVATAVVMPARLSVFPPTNIAKPTQLSSYQGYEHGAPLSDIGEEETEPEDDADRALTPRELNRSPTPNEVDEIAAEVEKLAAPQLRHSKRLSNISVGSNDSEKTEWDKFDTTKLTSDRVAADIAQARNAADTDSVASRRNSKENDEELSMLNDHAEQILESARKRLSHMEDNLTKARHSILLSSSRSSPNMHELGLGQQPGGGLYRSISQSAQSRRSRGFPIKPNTIMSHGRAGSDNVVAGTPNRQSRTPELRSASALEYGRPWLGVTTPDKLPNGHSPSSSRSFNSPLRILTEEAESPSTVKTSPDSGSTPTYIQHRGLGIHPSAAKGREDLSFGPKNDRSGTPTSIERSNSQASTRSARDLKDQMSEMKSRIAELKNKAQADTLRRRSVQNLRSSSPFNSSSPEVNGHTQWRPASPADLERAGTSLGHATGAGSGWRSVSQQSHHQRKDSALEEDVTQSRTPITPTMNRLLNVSTPAGTVSARTDRNTPNLVSKNGRQVGEALEFNSHGAHSSYDDPERSPISEDEGEDDVYANEEEQIYLNEVLEESLHEPDVPTIPVAFLAQDGGAEERHEDRLDAFDYENMFLHSAMGTYTGHGDSDEESEADSVETSLRDTATPVADNDSDNSDNNSDHAQDLNDSDDGRSAGSSPLSPSSPVSSHDSPVKSKTVVHGTGPKQPVRPWTKTSRSNSMDSTSSAATFETATEGHGRDLDEEGDSDDPDDILNWGTNSEHLPTPTRDQTLASSPLGAAIEIRGHDRHDSGSGMDPTDRNSVAGVIRRGPMQSSLIGNETSSMQTEGQRPRSTNFHHNGHMPRHMHQRNDSNDTDDSMEDQTTPVASSFAHQQSNIPRSRALHVSTSSSSSSVSRHTHTSSTSTITTIRQSNGQSAASKNLSSPNRSASAQSQRQLPFRTLNYASAPPSKHPSPATTVSTPHSTGSAHPANTEILMESLIKLADPSFCIRPDTRFAEVDKELVLNLLRALGGVCDGILRAEKQGDSEIVKELRGRLSDGEEVLMHGLGGQEADDDNDDNEQDDEDLEELIRQGMDDFEEDTASDVQAVRGLGIEGTIARH